VEETVARQNFKTLGDRQSLKDRDREWCDEKKRVVKSKEDGLAGEPLYPITKERDGKTSPYREARLHEQAARVDEAVAKVCD